jgi:hypothetical protein
MCVTDEIGRDNFLIGVPENAFQWTLGCFFDRSTDRFVRRLAEKAFAQITESDDHSLLCSNEQ